MNKMFFDDRVDIRIRRDECRIITKIVRKDPEKYDNESHFIRCAVIKLIREERNRLII